MDLSDEIYELKLDNRELLIELYQCIQFDSDWDKNFRIIHAPHIRTSKKDPTYLFPKFNNFRNFRNFTLITCEFITSG